jgi:hypothetical protein
MKYLKLKLVIVVLFSCSFGFSTVRICGNHTYPDGHTSRVCVYFYAKETKCDSADMLAIVSQPGGFTGGWTCQSDNFGIASANGGDASLIRTPDGKAYLKANGETSEVGSDAFSEYVKKVRRETANMRVNTQAIQSGMDTFLDSDNGFVSNEKLQKLSAELGVPIVVSRGWNPKDEPGYHQTKWSGKAAQPATSGTPGTKQAMKIPADACSLADCSCRVVSASGASLCEGGMEGETAAGVHFCKCGKFGPSTSQSDGGGGSFTVSDAGAIGQYDREDGGVKPVAKPTTPKPKPTSTGSVGEAFLQAQRQQISTPTPSVQGPAELSAQSAGGQQEKGTGETCIAEYELASGVEVFFRQDRKVTGVWRAKQDNGPKRDRPEYVFADANGCLYGCTGNVWEPLDCPGRDFSNPRTYPREFKLGASCSSTNISGPAWRPMNESRGRAMEAPPQEVPPSRFALVQPTSRPPQSHEPGGGPTTRKMICWPEEDEIGWWLKCCGYDQDFEILPIDPGPGVSLINEPDTVLCVPSGGMEMPDVQDGSIVMRTAGGKDYCLNPNGSFGACSTEFGIKEKGIK